MNHILVVGVNHKIAPIEVRERLAFGPERKSAAMRRLAAALEPGARCEVSAAPPEVVILSTCNRTELYACAEDAAHAEVAVRRFLADYAAEQGARPSAVDLDRSLYAYHGADAAQHLLRVAAGLDSLMIGENEILGQVCDAYEAAHDAGTTGPILSALFRHAVQAGKRVRTETEIGRAALSVATIVVELAEETFGPLADRTALLIGAGKMSSITGQALVKAGLRCVLVANRTHERAQQLAQSLGGHAVRFDALAENLAAADIVICSTGAPHLVLHIEDVAAALAARSSPQLPASSFQLLVVDLAVPRDADPAIAGLPGVQLTDLDDFDALVQANHPLVAAVRQAAETLVHEELTAFQAWYDARRSAPVIQALRARAEAICQAELERTLRRLGEITPEQRQTVEAMGRAIVNKLLHEPTIHLKEPPPGVSRADYVSLTNSLFGLN